MGPAIHWIRSARLRLTSHCHAGARTEAISRSEPRISERLPGESADSSGPGATAAAPAPSRREGQT